MVSGHLVAVGGSRRNADVISARQIVVPAREVQRDATVEHQPDFVSARMARNGCLSPGNSVAIIRSSVGDGPHRGAVFFAADPFKHKTDQILLGDLADTR